MPRIARNSLETSFFHIIVQGIGKEYIFEKDEYIQKYLYLLELNLKLYDIKIVAYCIMNNHAHILVYVESIKDMGKMMQRINTSYARYYNKDKNRAGYVFRDRYFTQPIITQKQLFNCIAYIHKNPIKANIIKETNKYKYSTYNYYINDNHGLIEEETIKLVFGSNKNYIDTFKMIHQVPDIEDIVDIVEEYQEYETIIKRYIDKEKVSIKDVINDDKKIKELIIKIKREAGMSLGEISNILNINKNRITKILKK